MADKRGTSAGKYTGQVGGSGGKFANPMGGAQGDTEIGGMGGGGQNLGEKTGFVTSGYIDKQGTPYGEAAKFNFLPPGMDISNQENTEIHNMPMKTLVGTSYPGDGWGGSRDVSE